MRIFLFAGDDVDFDGVEAGIVEELAEVHLGEAEPEIGVELARLLEAMGKEVDDGDASAGLEDAMGGGYRLGRADRVMKGLAEEGDIDAARR